jgi:dipeptidyl aminopeptidase/acylaminoacyl peptidase
MRSLTLASVLLFAWSSTGRAQQPAAADTAWDVTRPRGQTRTIDFTTTEGTWTSLDVSPDGTWIVFDLLGHIYRMPIAGGPAECLTQNSGIAINIHPRISPDGKQIAFVSDRNGQMNLWVMASDGSGPTPVHLDQKSEYRWPSWRADGQFLVALRRTPTTALMLFHKGGGRGIELLKAEPGKTPSRPTVSSDGRILYYDLTTGRGAMGWGREDALMGRIQVQALDLTTGVVRRITAGEAVQANADHTSSGGAYAAEPSPDGRSLAFLRKVPGGTLNYKGQRFGPRSALWIRDLATGAERLAMDPVEMDMSEESFPPGGTYPTYDWTPDARGIVIHQGGRIRRLDLASSQVTTIPFTARVNRVISEQAWSKNKLSEGPLEVRFVRWATAAPDGRTLAGGLGPHWDVWMLAKAAEPMTALEVASLHGATYLGLEDDLGSITVGKLGDLMVLNGNPLENIRNTADIQYVMKAGVLYDASSLDQIWPRSIKFGDYYWVVPEMYRIDEKRIDEPVRRPQ